MRGGDLMVIDGGLRTSEHDDKSISVKSSGKQYCVFYVYSVVFPCILRSRSSLVEGTY